MGDGKGWFGEPRRHSEAAMKGRSSAPTERTTNEYVGWKNKATWNVALYIGNDEPLYRAAVDYMKRYPESKHPYFNFIKSLGMERDKTPDGFKWASQILDYKELNEMMREFK